MKTALVSPMRRARVTRSRPPAPSATRARAMFAIRTRTAPAPPINLALRTRCRLRSEEHTSELQSLRQLVCRLLLEKKNTVDSMRAFPFTNASIDGENNIYKKDINLGIAVALDQGMLVTGILNADERNLHGVSRLTE